MSAENILNESIYRRNVCPVHHPGSGCMDRSLIMAGYLARHGGRPVRRPDLWAFWYERSQSRDGPWLAFVRLFSWFECRTKFFSHLSQTRDAVRYPGVSG